MASEIMRDPDLEWLDHVRPVGLVVAPRVLKELGLAPLHQTPADSGVVAELLNPDLEGPALADPWAFMEKVLGWEARYVAGAPGGPPLPDELVIRLPEHATTLAPTWAVKELGRDGSLWQLLVRIEPTGVDPDTRNALDGWEAKPQQRFERLLRDTGVFTGLLITDNILRLVHAPRGETSGHLSFPVRPLATVAGRPMLAGLKLVLGSVCLFTDADTHRLPALLKQSRDAQASVSTELAGQVLGALHELLRGLDAADAEMTRELARSNPGQLYEGLLTVLMRLVFTLYAEDRDLLPSRPDARAREIYETSYSVRCLYERLSEDAAHNPDTMDERRGGWGRLLALFRLVHKGHATHFVQARGGKLFDPDEFPFLEGRNNKGDPPRILDISDGTLLRILEGLMTLKLHGQERERLSYRSLDVEQIGSVYETVMGFTVEVASGPALAIKAGKNNKTPVFVALDALLARKGKDRIKELKDGAGRSLTATQAKPVEAARTVGELAAALDTIVDERGSPQHVVAPKDTPILQPTDERRRTGSHYTPRSLTAPIVTHALEPAFDRLGPDAMPEQVLDLKVCDPAMGSGAFLVEACRALASRLVQAWARWPEKRPTIPADEDEELHARRLVAQRCLYGVDRNPRAVDLARLSLWLATLARDHEFTFLDHALKCGDSLVGLTPSQIAAANWDEKKPGLPLFQGLVRNQVAEAEKARAEIQSAPDDTARAIQEARHKHLEKRLSPVRIAGDAVISAFFAVDKHKAREKARAEVESWLSGMPPRWELVEAASRRLHSGEHPIPPFHWAVEFPEVFTHDNGGFDAIVGNPPFAGKNTIINGNRQNYLPWLQVLHENTHGNADLVAHFFRRAFGLLRQGGVAGLIATNTIGQGDTRASGLSHILANGGAILRAKRRLKWPGEAAVVVSVAHIARGVASAPILDDRLVRRISAYLVEGNMDVSPSALIANNGRAFKGTEVGGFGFLFDDQNTSKGSHPISAMHKLIKKNPNNIQRILPYIGGEELNNDPRQSASRYSMFFSDLTESVVLSEWPELAALAERVREERCDPKAKAYSERHRREWWLFRSPSHKLYQQLRDMACVFAIARVAPNFGVACLSSKHVFSEQLIVFTFESYAAFSILQTRPHELWTRTFSSSFKDDLRYVPSDCFRTFPFSTAMENNPSLESIGREYHAFRAEALVARGEGLTKIYNRFHDQNERSVDILHLRDLHAAMDAAVLCSYGWNDLADRAMPVFIEQDADEGKTPKTRLDWPAEFKDEVLTRLLALNAERAAAERAAGLVASGDDEEDETEGEGEAE